MNSLNLILCAAAIAALDICVFVLIITAYCEKRSSKRNWHELAHDMELAEQDKIYDLGCDEVLIGRHASADIRLPDLSVSRYHAMLTVSNGIWTIKDIGSKSGVFVNGNLIGVMGLPPFLATLSTCMITRGISSMVMATPWPTNKQPGGWFHSIFKLTFGTGRNALKLPIGFVLVVLLVLIMEFVLNHTKFGRYTIAIGSNKEAVILSGINVKFYHVMAYTICGTFAGLAAIAYAAVVPTVQPGTGAGLELDAIGGVFVGGVSATGGYGSVIGTLAGVFVIVLLKTGLPYVGLQANWQQIITGIVLIGAVMIDVAKRRRLAKEI